MKDITTKSGKEIFNIKIWQSIVNIFLFIFAKLINKQEYLKNFIEININKSN